MRFRAVGLFLIVLVSAMSAAQHVRADAPSARALKAGQPKRYVVNIENLKFKPATIEIDVGDIVVWVNNDDLEHNVTARDGSFTSGNLASGKAYEHKFDKPGKVEYDDDLHPRMAGTVVVKGK